MLTHAITVERATRSAYIERRGVSNAGINRSDRELSRACEQFIKQEDEGKFRCKTCQKLFKATSFVEKHISNKHPELVKLLEEVRASL